MKSLKKIGSVAAGVMLLGGALSGAVAAGLDTTGLTKDFFYDTNMNPMVQVVVGEKGMASDAVSAGNIAAVIGNLAYTSTESEVTASGAAEGQVTIGVSALGATGKYVQPDHPYLGMHIDLDMNNKGEFYYVDDDGLLFGLTSETYQKGEFVSYSLACDTQQRAEAGILKEVTYTNVHCLFCQTLCLASLENPEHEMSEKITLDNTRIGYTQLGMGNDESEMLVLGALKDAVSYTIEAGEIPISARIGSSGSEIDFEWRGKFLFFGDEYYVKDAKGLDTLYLAKGKVLNDVSSEGFTSEYLGYKFKIDHLVYSQEYQVAGMVLDVEKPDGTVVQTQISKQANGIIDDIEVAGVYAEESDQVASGSLLVYDTTTNFKVEDGKEMELSGQKIPYWRVNFGTTTNTQGGAAFDALDTTEYRGQAGTILDNITMRYRKKFGIPPGYGFPFPSTFQLMFMGFRTKDYRPAATSGDGEGNIKIERDGDYQLLLSFTDDGGNRFNDVHLDQGPFSEGDLFILNGNVYEYDEAEEQTDDVTMRITLKDLLNGGKVEVDLTAVTSASFTYTTVPFEETAENEDTTTVDPDSVAADSDVFAGTYRTIPITYDGGEIYLATAASQDIGVSASVIGAALDDFEGSGNTLSLDVVAETGTDLNEYEETTANTDTDDIIIRVLNEDGEYVYIDFYDRDYNSSTDVYYDESVKFSQYPLPLNATSPYGTKLDDDRDTTVWLPLGGDVVMVDYGADFQIEGVEIIHPQKDVYATYFIGTTEEATLLESTVTEADVGATKTAGCCTFTVKDFSVSGDAATATTSDVQMQDITGNLVVSESGANVNKNLIIVGGPAVNGMTTVTADEIAAASQKYIVKKDGKKLVVAGWTASDTIDAGNALISWLKANVH